MNKLVRVNLIKSLSENPHWRKFYDYPLNLKGQNVIKTAR